MVVKWLMVLLSFGFCWKSLGAGRYLAASMKGCYKKALLIVFGIGTVALLLTALLRPNEPVYQGKRLSEWLEQLARVPYPERGSETATKAIRELGTNAVPCLVRVLQDRDSKIEAKFIEWIRKQSAIKVSFLLASERRAAACDALWILGSNAKDAIPEIGALFNDNARCFDASMALLAIGSESIPVFTEACSHTNKSVRAQAAFMLSKLTPLNRRGFTTTYFPAGSTNRIYGLAITLGDDDIKALVTNLRDPRSSVRRATAEALGWHSGIARPAVPGLVQALGDVDKDVRTAAATALKAIDPKAAAEAGVK